jgi:hypothetical protein
MVVYLTKAITKELSLVNKIITEAALTKIIALTEI